MTQAQLPSKPAKKETISNLALAAKLTVKAQFYKWFIRRDYRRNNKPRWAPYSRGNLVCMSTGYEMYVYYFKDEELGRLAIHFKEDAIRTFSLLSYGWAYVDENKVFRRSGALSETKCRLIKNYSSFWNLKKD